ncbi:MAG: hypothetical protein K9K64_15500 [Desulfohalobiaceae bacterium]|nr:hypothetical protein [Desulfohalobiaceae bacterium]
MSSRTRTAGSSEIGIDSQNYPMPEREAVWRKLAGKWKPKQLLDSYDQITLPELSGWIDLMLAGKSRGRTVVRL